MSSRPDLPRVIAHRGAAAYAPENTLASLREAKRRGARWVEFDVKLSMDGVAILMHDNSLRRTTGIDRTVLATTWRQMEALDAGSWFDRGYAGERIPSLDSAIACLLESGLGANVEVKPCPVRESATAQAVCEALRRLWPASAPIPLISSFNDLSLDAARLAAPEYPRALLMSKLSPDWLQRAQRLQVVGINVGARQLTAEEARAIKAEGFLLSAYTINDAEQARMLTAMGVDCIITDRPDTIISALGSA